MIQVVLCDDHAVLRRGIRDTLQEATDIRVTAEAPRGNDRWSEVPLSARIVMTVTALLVMGLTVGGAATITLLRVNLVQQVDDDLYALAQELDDVPLTILEGNAPATLPSNYFVRITPYADPSEALHPSVPRPYPGPALLAGALADAAPERPHRSRIPRKTRAAMAAAAAASQAAIPPAPGEVAPGTGNAIPAPVMAAAAEPWNAGQPPEIEGIAAEDMAETRQDDDIALRKAPQDEDEIANQRRSAR